MSDEQANDFTITGPTFTEDGFTVGVIHLLTERKAEYEYKALDERVRQGLIALGWTPPDAPAMTREEAMAKWGLMPVPNVEIKGHEVKVLPLSGESYTDTCYYILVGGVHVSIQRHYSSEEVAVCGYDSAQLQRALGITEGGAS